MTSSVLEMASFVDGAAVVDVVVILQPTSNRVTNNKSILQTHNNISDNEQNTTVTFLANLVRSQKRTI